MIRETINSIRGMNDLLPPESSAWRKVEGVIIDVLESYHFRELRVPLLEKSELFSRGIGEVTDIVEKEMYSFASRGGSSLSLRPEGTAGAVRACIQNRLLETPQRLWYSGPMFRYERPQAGRQRQFHQFGAEAFGMPGPDIDVEVIALTARLWQRLGIADSCWLELNSLGSANSRVRHRNALVDYFSANQELLDEDSQRRLQTNPLRILDSKNPGMRELIDSAPRLGDYLEDECRLHFQGVQEQLDNLGITYKINPNLVRGLDYYNRTVFEWVTDRLGAQGTICGGGRYDGLVEQLGGKPTQGLGFGLGVERLMLLIEQVVGLDKSAGDAHIYLTHEAAGALQAMQLAERLRDQLPGKRIEMHCGGGSFKSQFKRADRSGAEFALILGGNELRDRRISLKFLREERPQESLSYEELVERLRSE